jgi:hypothetical protein
MWIGAVCHVGNGCRANKRKTKRENAKPGESSLNYYPQGDNFSGKISTAQKYGQRDKCTRFYGKLR